MGWLRRPLVGSLIDIRLFEFTAARFSLSLSASVSVCLPVRLSFFSSLLISLIPRISLISLSSYLSYLSISPSLSPYQVIPASYWSYWPNSPLP